MTAPPSARSYWPDAAAVQPARGTMPSPSAVTSSPFDHLVMFTSEMLPELVSIKSSALLSSQFRCTFAVDAPVS